MQGKSFWYFLGVGLFIGLSMEVMKASAPDQDKLQRLARLQAIAKDDEPVYVPAARADSSKRSRIAKRFEAEATLGGLSAPEPSSSPQPSAADATTEAAKKKKADEEAKKKKKAEDDKKKKKKKKKKKVEGEKKEEEKKDEEKKDEKTDGDGVDPNADAVGGVGAFFVPPPNSGLRQTVAEWEAYLLPQADFDRTTELVRAFQAGTIKEEVFYPVIETMLGDARPRMHELGVMALGSVPSGKSFQYLAAFLKTETRASKARTQAQGYIRTYTRIENVRHLASSLHPNSDAAVIQQALTVLSLAAETHLKTPVAREQSNNVPGNGNVPNPPGQPSPPNPNAPQTPNQVRTPASSVLRAFDGFIPALNRLSVGTADANTRQSAAQTLSRLQSLMSMRTP